VTGLVTAFGSGAMTNSFDDIVNDAKVYFIIGSNTTENHPVLGMRLRQSIKRGAKLIVCDPRAIPITDFATLHIAQKPGTDIALLNGIMHVLITEGLYDETFVAERTEGFEALKATVLEYPPQRAAEICGVAPEEIIQAAHLLGENRPGALLYAMGITQHTTGHQNVLSCANLQMLLGNMGVPGGGVNPLRGQNNVQGACDVGALPNVFPGYQKVVSDDVVQKFAQAWGVTGMDDQVGLTVTEMLDGADKGTFKALYILGENPMLSEPDLNHAEHCLRSLDFLVVQDIFMTETAALADVVLPGVSFAEKLGTFTNSERRVQFVRPAVPAPGVARQDWWIVGEVARRMGYEGLTYDSPREIMDEINRLTPIYGGIAYDRIGEMGLQWPCPDAEHPGTPILHVGKFSRGLGHFSAVEWAPPAEEPDEDYPFVFTTGRVLYHFHTGSMTRRSEGLEAIYPEPVVEINTQDAGDLNIVQGDMIKVASRRGEIQAKALVSDTTEPGVVFMAWHFAEAAANKLTVSALDPVGKIPEYKVCAVKVTAA
jgi:formate dehydrogenase alpha subunit